MRPTITNSVKTITTYSVTARNCRGMSVTFSNLGCLTAKSVAEILSYAFRDLEVVCDQTGEIMYNIYKDLEWYHATNTEEGAIKEVKLFLASR